MRCRAGAVEAEGEGAGAGGVAEEGTREASVGGRVSRKVKVFCLCFSLFPSLVVSSRLTYLLLSVSPSAVPLSPPHCRCFSSSPLAHLNRSWPSFLFLLLQLLFVVHLRSWSVSLRRDRRWTDRLSIGSQLERHIRSSGKEERYYLLLMKNIEELDLFFFKKKKKI